MLGLNASIEAARAGEVGKGSELLQIKLGSYPSSLEYSSKDKGINR